MKVCPICGREHGDGESVCRADGSILSLAQGATLTSTGQPAPAPTAEHLVGAVLADRYEITRKLGQGGMGVVYEARHRGLGKRVAVKVLLDKHAEKPDVVRRLQREAKLASTVRHEHIVDVTDVGVTADGRAFVVMEFLEGESLGELLRREDRLPLPRALAIGRQVAAALHAAHDEGIVHRDLKPENIFVTRRNGKDFVKVVDFGISKAILPLHAGETSHLTETGVVLGTPLYMSPEQARGDDDVDQRTDVHALGAILYECLTGAVPFRGPNPLAVISRVISVEAVPPTRACPQAKLPAAVDAVILRALAKSRDDRYATMAALEADLERLEQGETPAAPPAPTKAKTPTPVPAAHAPAPRSRRRWAWIAVAVTLFVAVGGGTTSWRRHREAQSKKQEPQEPPPRDSDPNRVVVETPYTPRIEIPVPPAGMVPPMPPVPIPPHRGESITFQVMSDPPGATVYLGDEEVTETPGQITVPRGTTPLQLTFRLEGHDDVDKTVVPTKDREVRVTLKPTRE